MTGLPAARRALVCDMDGTLTDSAAAVPDAFLETVRRLGVLAPDRQDVVVLYFLGPPDRMLTRLLGRPCGADDLDLYHTILNGTAQQARRYPGVGAALQRLYDTVPLAVFTGASRRAARILLSATGLDTYFAVLVGGDEVQQQKPAPEGMLLACQRLGVSPTDAVYLGDAPSDLEAARRANALPAGAQWGYLYDTHAPAESSYRLPTTSRASSTRCTGLSSARTGYGAIIGAGHRPISHR